MKNASFRQKLLTSFLAIGILPLLICTLLMLNIFRLSLTRSEADAAETQLDAMSGELSGLLSDCETVMEKLCAEPAVAAALDRSELDEQRVYSVLYRAAAPVLGGASLSVYGADGRQLYSTSSQPASGSLSPRWGLLAAAADGGVVYRGASSKSSACIQAACAVRRGSVPLGYVVADVTAAQLTALFDGQHTATSRLLLLDPFWDQVYASSDLPAKTLAARLRSQLLAGQALSDSHGAYDYFVRQEPRSGFCLVLQQPKPMTEGTAELMYLVAGLSLLLCLGLCVLASMRFSRQLFEPIRALNSAMREVEEGNLNVQLDNRRIDEMGQLSGRFNRMAQRLRQNLKDSLRQQRELNEAQIRMMQAQLNPHFLYNTLDTIKWMGKIHQAPEIATISADLADILRSSISADELVPLRQELRLVERYVEIQNIRFSGAFALTVEVDEPLRDVPVPKLMLQPLVENAILHGFRDRSGGEIRISAYRTEEDPHRPGQWLRRAGGGPGPVSGRRAPARRALRPAQCGRHPTHPVRTGPGRPLRPRAGRGRVHPHHTSGFQERRGTAMLKVVVVEDEELVRKGIVLTVDWAGAGCAVVGEAANGEEGLEVIRRYRPDLIVTDIRMPKLDGIEMLRRLREEGNRAHVVFLTAYSDFSYAQSALKLGAADYLLKPFHDGELEETIARIRSRAQAAAPAAPAAPVLPEGQGPEKSKYVREALTYLSEHYNDPDISVSSVARSLGVSDGHLSHVFKKETSYTLSAYLTNYRMHKATELLRDCRVKVYEVAESVGYRDITYFSSAFKKSVGMSPSEYQKRCQ